MSLCQCCTHTQLYNEEVNDLLAPQNVKLAVHEGKEGGWPAVLRSFVLSMPHANMLAPEIASKHQPCALPPLAPGVYVVGLREDIVTSPEEVGATRACTCATPCP